MPRFSEAALLNDEAVPFHKQYSKIVDTDLPVALCNHVSDSRQVQEASVTLISYKYQCFSNTEFL